VYNGVINLFRSAVYPPLTAYSQTQDLAPSIPRNFFSYPRKTGVYCEAKLQGELRWVFCCRNAADKKGASRTPMSATCAESQPLLAKRIRPFGCGKRSSLVELRLARARPLAATQVQHERASLSEERLLSVR